MTSTAYRAKSQIKVLNQLLSKFAVETQDAPNPHEGGEPIVTITRLRISLYTDFQKGEVTSFLENPNENRELSATDYIYYALDCVSNVRGRVHTEDACNIINAKAPGLVNHLKCRIPRSTSVPGMTPTDLFYAFGTWINTTLGSLIENKLTISKQITTTVINYSAAHNALPGTVIRAKLTNNREDATRLGIAVADLREKFVAELDQYLMEPVTFPLSLGEECGFTPDTNLVPSLAIFANITKQG